MPEVLFRDCKKRGGNFLEAQTVKAMLKRRGFEILKSNPTEYLVFPPDWDSSFEDELYGMLKKYSFRIFIRDVIKNRKSFGVDDLLKYTTREWVERYIEFLLERGVIEGTRRERYRLKAESVFSFGDTLEWFVARVFEREFSCPALWGVRVGGARARAGGDYDCMVSVEGRLVCVEVKSSPPKNVEEVEVRSFLKRVEALNPDMAIFLEDTKLRMKDKIVPFFEGLLKGKRVERLQAELFGVEDKLFIINSGPDIVKNLGFCIRRHLSKKSFW